jgi:two-component system cell cycle sensor histidine kinase/response regulator CckA
LALAIRRTTFVLVCFVLAASSCDAARPNVFVLNSFQQGLSWTDRILAGARSELCDRRGAINVYMDYLDSKRIVPDSEYFRLRYELYRYAYRTRKFQVIACTDDDALAFMLEYGDKLFPGVPVVFCGATEHLEKVAERRDLYTGIVDDSNLETNIALAVRLFPETRRLVFVHDSTTSGINQAKDAMALKPRFPRLTFEFISNVGLDEIKKRVRALPSDAVLFPLAYTTEPSGEIHTFEEAAKAIASASKVPVIAFREYQLEDGVVGGYVVSGEDQGRAAARMIESIIEGGRPRDIPIIRDSPAHYILTTSRSGASAFRRASYPREAE